MNELPSIEDLYFRWLMTYLSPDGVKEGVVYICSLLHNCTFRRNVGRDHNRAVQGTILRKHFLDYEDLEFDPDELEEFLGFECTWLEMLIALADQMAFMYEGTVQSRFLEMTDNMGLAPLTRYNPHRSRRLEEYDQGFVNIVTRKIDNNLFDRDGHGGLFPLQEHGGRDQREVEIWIQHADYFNEKLGYSEGA